VRGGSGLRCRRRGRRRRDNDAARHKGVQATVIVIRPGSREHEFAGSGM
jgi:hypothetical protein